MSDHGFKCPSGDLISTDKSECVAKFCVASVFDFAQMMQVGTALLSPLKDGLGNNGYL